LPILTYKLWYLYYNVAGSIRVPAPLRYANWLAKLLTERSQNIILPNKNLEPKCDLYYI